MSVQAQSESASASLTPRSWLAGIGAGVAVGATIALLDIARYFPFVSVPGAFGPASILSSVLLWSAEGALAGAAVTMAERRVPAGGTRALPLALALLVGVVASVVLCHTIAVYVLRDQFGIRQFRDYLGQPVVLAGGMLYHAWLLLFFGGLAVAAYVSLRRRARMFAALYEARMRRESSHNRLAEANLVAVRERVDPDYLFSQLALLERLYESDPNAADRVLSQLIAFLRGVLADIRAAAPA